MSWKRVTKETQIIVNQCQVGAADPSIHINTPLGFFTHLLEQLAFHGGLSLSLEAQGDVHVDEHHLIEDTAILLGKVLQETWVQQGKPDRYASVLLPMDEVLVMMAIDWCFRPFCRVDFPFSREQVGGLACEMVPHFFQSLAYSAQWCAHLELPRAGNHHHMIEGSFKALGRCLRQLMGTRGVGSSTKGALGCP